MEILVVFSHIEIYRTLALVGIARLKDLLDVFNLLDDMAGGVRLYAWGKHIECLHIVVVTVEIVLHHFHWLQLLETRLLSNLVFAGIGIMLEMAYIGDVAHVAHLHALMLEVAEEDVEGDGRSGMTQMGIAVDSRTADIHTNTPLMEGLEGLLSAGEGVIDV